MADDSLDYEAFTRLLLKHEPSIRSYVRSMLPTCDGVDDVLQEVAIVAWRKFGQLEDGEDFRLWVCVIARFEVLKWRRKHARDRLVFREETLKLLADCELERLEARERERRVLDGCLDKMSPAERALLMSVHTPGSSVARIAQESGREVKRLYRQLDKLRAALRACVATSLSAKGELS